MLREEFVRFFGIYTEILSGIISLDFSPDYGPEFCYFSPEFGMNF